MDPSSAPLADYFWIAGIDSVSYHDLPETTNSGHTTNGLPTVEDSTIAEGPEEGQDEPILGSAPRSSTARHSRGSLQRLSRLSIDARNSIQSLEALDTYSGSNRSSLTVRAVPSNGTQESAKQGLSDFDFDRALFKFANERETFLDDLSFSAGTVMQSRPPMTARAEKIKHDEEGLGGRKSPFGRVGGSIRRKISFRDLNSSKKQTINRSVSSRTSKRLSNYNSVIPPPEPLNADPDMHPLKRRLEPVLLDRYPPKTATDELQRRGRFPDYVPMFAFPNDINIVSSDERPRSTWHGFAMTGDDNAKIYGITVIVWLPLGADAAAAVERKCEDWRQSHMTNEERELAASLGERLAGERAHLSQLLAQLPTMASGSTARDDLEDRISSVEEKISLMTDMLRPVRHGAASKIEGLTDGDTGLWTPRAYGILGRDAGLTSFWKEWLRAVIVPMTDSGVLRVPPSSPKVGRWQPLERYVVNLCTEALSPITSKTQVEIAVRELRLFARKEAVNELPESRNADLYALFRALTIPNIVALLEFALSESRIIFLSSHTAMLHLATKALITLLYPFKWASIFIPVLPARLISALEAPCPYIVGIERRYENVDLPDDDYVLVDLDNDTIESTTPPVSLPRQQRRKLFSLLQLAAPHHNKFGVPVGPPPYAIETFPYDAFSGEIPSLFTQNSAPSTLSKFVSQSSTTFVEENVKTTSRPLVFNAFLQSKNDHTRVERPSTSKSNTPSSPPQTAISPNSTHFPNMPNTPMTRNESGFTLTSTLKEKRSGHFEPISRRSSSFGVGDNVPYRKPEPRFTAGHSASLSASAISIDSKSIYGYAPSSYAVSTLAASTVMPSMLMQPVSSSSETVWVEGHCLNWESRDTSSVCSVCDEKADSDGTYGCSGCSITAHSRCLGQVSLICPSAFNADKVRAAFVRCFASFLYTYRKHLKPATTKEQKAAKQIYAFEMEGFERSLPGEMSEYVGALRQTQAFNEFIHERETTPASSPSIRLFDEIILAKRNRGFSTSSFFSKAKTSFLEDRSDHLWRSASVPSPSGAFKGEYKSVICRMPARLDPELMREPRVIGGVPRVVVNGGKRMGRKAVPSLLGPRGVK
ncbi:hypothetical protein V500_09883 [Pseudogymnoascus sp. VKM F-4518 (FW-2643)]|nr:hypothetical protein V500_09883 [Pseudogymnoascus sp. VKM F-4518 (FW-2643)]KFZ08015.1 hypothetical protein V502_09602 [Pseudogymnoascus sp. VKM F-4520 (FW-2644)]